MEKNELEKIVNESNSFSEILQKQGKAVSGAAIKVLKNTLDAYDIDYHLLYYRKPLETKEWTEEEIFSENSMVPRKFLKKYLIEKGVKKNCCEICFNNGIWQDKPLTIQLHHINGVRNDNRMENLIMLCPNCHSQTENYAGGQKKKKANHCKDCGKEICQTSTFCTKCSAKRKNKPKVLNKPSKDELYNLIISKSFVEIGKMYGVSDKAIVKWCINYKLPSTKKEIKSILASSNG